MRQTKAKLYTFFTEISKYWLEPHQIKGFYIVCTHLFLFFEGTKLNNLKKTLKIRSKNNNGKYKTETLVSVGATTERIVSKNDKKTKKYFQEHVTACISTTSFAG